MARTKEEMKGCDDVQPVTPDCQDFGVRDQQSGLLPEEIPTELKPTFDIQGTHLNPVPKRGLSMRERKGNDRMDGEPLVRLTLSRVSGIIVFTSLFLLLVILPNAEGGHQLPSKDILDYILIALMTLRLFAVPLRFTPPFSFSFVRICAHAGSLEERQNLKNMSDTNLQGNNQDIPDIPDIPDSPSSSTSTNTPPTSSNRLEDSNDGSKRSNRRPRLHYMSNIKTIIIACVVLVHSAIPFGGFFLGAYRNSFSITMSVLIFLVYPLAMPLCFFLSAYFMIPSFQAKGRRQFLSKRSLRLTPIFLWIYFALYPLFEYVLAKTLMPPYLQPYVKFQFDEGLGWFLALLVVFSFVFVAVVEAWCPMEETGNEMKSSHDHEEESSTTGVEQQAIIIVDQDPESSSMEVNRKVIPLSKYYIASALVGGMEGIRRVYAPHFSMSGSGNIGFFILQAIIGCVAQKNGWLSTPKNYGILTKKQRQTSTFVILLAMLVVILTILRDIFDKDGADTIIPFKNTCGDSEVVQGHGNPANRLDQTKNDPVAIILSFILYICLTLYMVAISMFTLDLAKRRLDYTNRLLGILDRCSYGVYATHLLFVMVLAPAYIKILKSAGVIENEFVFNEEGLSPSCIGDNDAFIWLGVLFVFTFSYLGSHLLVPCLLKLPGFRFIL